MPALQGHERLAKIIAAISRFNRATFKPTASTKPSDIQVKRLEKVAFFQNLFETLDNRYANATSEMERAACIEEMASAERMRQWFARPNADPNSHPDTYFKPLPYVKREVLRAHGLLQPQEDSLEDEQKSDEDSVKSLLVAEFGLQRLSEHEREKFPEFEYIDPDRLIVMGRASVIANAQNKDIHLGERVDIKEVFVDRFQVYFRFGSDCYIRNTWVNAARKILEKANQPCELYLTASGGTGIVKSKDVLLFFASRAHQEYDPIELKMAFTYPIEVYNKVAATKNEILANIVNEKKSTNKYILITSVLFTFEGDSQKVLAAIGQSLILPSPMSKESFKGEITREVAENAFRNISWDPDKRAESFRESYTNTLIEVRDEFLQKINPERITEFQEDFENFHVKYRDAAMRYLGALSRTASSAVVGPSKFPKARNEKAQVQEEKRHAEMLALVESTKKSLAKKYVPTKSKVIRSGEADTIAKLQEKLDALQHDHDIMKQANQIIRKNVDVEKNLLALGLNDKQIHSILNPYQSGGQPLEPGYPTWQLTNMNAEIKRLKDRIAQEKTLQKTLVSSPSEGGEPRSKETMVGNTKIVENVSANRLQLIFKDKPDSKIREQLKHHGFHYSPKEQLWQRQLTNAAIKDARDILGVIDDGQPVNPEENLGGMIYWQGLEAVPISDINHQMNQASGILRYDIYAGPKGEYLDRVDLDKEDTLESAKKKVVSWIDNYSSEKWKGERDAKRDLEWAKHELKRNDNDIAYRTGPGAEETHIWLGDAETYAMKVWKEKLMEYIDLLEHDASSLPRPSYTEVQSAAHEEFYQKNKATGGVPSISDVYGSLTMDELIKAMAKLGITPPFNLDSPSIGKPSIARFLSNLGITPEIIASTLGITLEPNRVVLLPENDLPHVKTGKSLSKTTMYVAKYDFPWNEFAPITPRYPIQIVMGVLTDTSHFQGEYDPHAADLFVLVPNDTNPRHAIHGLDLKSAMDTNKVSIAYLVREFPRKVAQDREQHARKARLARVDSLIQQQQTAIASRKDDLTRRIEGAIGPVGIAGMEGELAALESYKASVERGEDPPAPDLERARDAASSKCSAELHHQHEQEEAEGIENRLQLASESKAIEIINARKFGLLDLSTLKRVLFSLDAKQAEIDLLEGEGKDAIVQAIIERSDKLEQDVNLKEVLDEVQQFIKRYVHDFATSFGLTISQAAKEYGLMLETTKPISKSKPKSFAEKKRLTKADKEEMSKWPNVTYTDKLVLGLPLTPEEQQKRRKEGAYFTRNAAIERETLERIIREHETAN